MSKPVNKNHLRIINKSTQLFNEYGVLKVTVQRIADVLKLSPGNITYHFKKKNDIIHSIIDSLEDDIFAVLSEVDTDRSPRDYTRTYVGVAEVLCDYRFVFNNIVYLNSEDRQFGRRYKQVQDSVISSLVTLADSAISKGWLRAVKAPDNTQLMCENLWHIWLSSLRLSQLDSGTVRKKRQHIISQLCIHPLVFATRYCTDDFSKSLVTSFEEYFDTDGAHISAH